MKKYPQLYSLFCLSALVFACSLSGCATPAENAQELLDRLEFGPDEYGTFELEGNIDLSGIPFVGATAHMKLEKFKDKPNQIEEVTP